MTDETVKRFLRYHKASLVDLALAEVELDDKELKVIDLCGRKRLTIEQAAEVLDVSDSTVKRTWAKARKRLIKAWSGQEYIEVLANYAE